MRADTPEHSGPLRTGLTTGTCATAAAMAAARAWLGDQLPAQVDLSLPRGETVTMTLSFCQPTPNAVEAGVIKDAGDDPDATHGATVWVRLSGRHQPGLVFRAGEGVGTVTQTGLPVAVGEPAINPVPRQMIDTHLRQVAAGYGYTGGFDITVGIVDGAELAQRTMNPRLGIRGGLSILGTTGIVRPFSCAAYIASIHQGIEVARSNGLRHIAACTGATSERAVQAHYGLPAMALIEMGDLIGAVIKHLKAHPVTRLTVVGGFGKLSKVAAGHLDTHSRKAAVDFDFLAGEAAALGADETLQAQMRHANTSLEAWTHCRTAGLPLGERICQRAYDFLRQRLPASIALETWAVDRASAVIGQAGER